MVGLMTLFLAQAGTLSSVAFSQNYCQGGKSITFYVNIVPQSVATTIQLTRLSGPRASVPPSITIAAGQGTGEASIIVPETEQVSELTVGASLGGQAITAAIPVTPTFGVSAIGVGSGNFALDWIAMPNATSYDVYRISNSGVSTPLALNINPTHSVPGSSDRRRFVASGSAATMETVRYFQVFANRPAGRIGSAIVSANSTIDDLPLTSANPQAIIDKVKSNLTQYDPAELGAPTSVTVFSPDGSAYTQSPGTPAVRIASGSSEEPYGAQTGDGEFGPSFPTLSSSFPYQNPNRKEGQLYRKIEGSSGFTYLTAPVTLASSVNVYSTSRNGKIISDGAFIYTGGYVVGTAISAMDAGFMRNVNAGTGLLNPFYIIGSLHSEDGSKAVNRYDKRVVADPGATLICFQSAPGNTSASSGWMSLRVVGGLKYKSATLIPIPDHSVVFLARGWNSSNSFNRRPKIVTSIAQIVRRTQEGALSSQIQHFERTGYFKVPNVYSRFSEWGPYVLVDGQYMDASIVQQQGVFPNSSAVRKLTQNEWFWEQNIDLDASR